jgi:hypothetical protein
MKKMNEWPIPVVMDRRWRWTKDYTVKDWFLKEQEELAEFYDEVTHYIDLDKLPSKVLWDEDGRDRVLEEACDQIHTIFSKLQQFGYTEDEIAAGIRRSNEKARERGLIE